MTDQKKPGVEVRRQVMGDAFVDRALGNATAFTITPDPLITQYPVRVLW